MLRWIAVASCASVLLACGAADEAREGRRPEEIAAPVTDTFELPRPNVIVEADPAPPFTYWAPEGSVIRNHGNPGLWVAYLNGRNVKTYFGDQCHASSLQQFVGQPLSAMPPAPEGTIVRTFCTTCERHDDLRPNRINVAFNETAQLIEEIACY